MNKIDIERLKRIFEIASDQNIVIYNHCFDNRIRINGGLDWFEETTGLSETGFYRDSRAGGIRELADGTPEIQKSFMRFIDVPIQKHGINKNQKIIVVMQPHNDCSDYALAYNLVSPFKEPTKTQGAYIEKMLQVDHMDKTEQLIRNNYRHLPNIQFEFIHTRAVLLDEDAENICFNVLKIR